MKPALCCMIAFLTVQGALSQTTYPLQNGNRWQYKEPPSPQDPYYYEDRVIGDTLMPNGALYKVIQEGPVGTASYYYFRQASEQVYEYLTYGDSLRRNQEIVRFDFSRRLLDTVSIFQITARDTVVITVIDTGMIQIFGRTRHFMTFFWSERGGAFYRANRVVDSIGIVFTQIEPGLQFYLAGAVINGVTYGQVTSVDRSFPEEGSSISLFQNHPNPFNPFTTIYYELSRASHVTLTVYNVLGREVATLVNGMKEPGYKSVEFNASNLASGIYFYRLTAGDFTKTKKLMVLR